MDASLIQSLIVFVVALVVSAGAVRAMRAANLSPNRINAMLTFADSVVLALEEAYPNAAGQEKLTTALDRVCAKFGIDREEAGVYVQAAVSGLRQAGIKPERATEPNQAVVDGAKAVYEIRDELKGALASEDPALD